MAAFLAAALLLAFAILAEALAWTGRSGIGSALGLTDLELNPAVLSPPAERRIPLVLVAYGVAAAGASLALLIRPWRGWILSQLSQIRDAGALEIAAATRDYRGLAQFERVVLVSACLCGLAARLWLATLPLGPDEATSYILFASRTLADVLTDYSIPNNHVAHTIAVWASAGVFGASAFSIRIPALIASISLVPLGFLAGRALGGKHAAAAAATVLALAPPVMEAGAQARGYAVSSALCLGALVALGSAGEASPRRTVVGGLLLGLALYAVPTAGMAIAVIAVWCMADATLGSWRARMRDLVLLGGVTCAVALILYAPIVARTGLDSVVASQVLQAKGGARALAASWRSVEASVLSPAVFVVPVMVLCLMATVIRRQRRTRAATLCIALIVGPLALYSVKPFVMQARYALDVFVLAMVLVAAGAVGAVSGSRSGRYAPAVWAMLVVAWFGHWVVPAVGRHELCCRDGAVRDVAWLADGALHLATEKGPLVLPAYSGDVEKTRFHLRAAHAALRLILPYYPQLPLEQLAGFDTLLVASDAASGLSALAAMTHVRQDSVEMLFKPIPWPDGVTPRFARLGWRAPPPADVRARWAKRSIVTYGW